MAALCFMNLLDLITVLFIQFLWFNIHTLMSRLFLSPICRKPYFSFLVHFQSFWSTILLEIRLFNVMYPKFFVCLLLLMFYRQYKPLHFASPAEKGSLIDRIQLLDWNKAARFYLTFVGHFISFDYSTIKKVSNPWTLSHTSAHNSVMIDTPLKKKYGNQRLDS